MAVDRRHPLSRVERRGGSVSVVPSGRALPLFELHYIGSDGGRATIHGHIPAKRMPVGPVREDLRRLGWRQASRGWQQRWVLAADADRERLHRVTHATLALLAPDSRSRYRIVYQPPGEQDAGYAQIGCFFAILSLIASVYFAIVVTFFTGFAAHAGVVDAALAIVLGAAAGMIFGTYAPRVLAIVPALRVKAPDVVLWLMLVVPGTVVLAVWLYAGPVGPTDAMTAIVVGGVIVLAVVLWSLWPTVSLAHHAAPWPVPDNVHHRLPREGARRDVLGGDEKPTPPRGLVGALDQLLSA